MKHTNVRFIVLSIFLFLFLLPLSRLALADKVCPPNCSLDDSCCFDGDACTTDICVTGACIHTTGACLPRDTVSPPPATCGGYAAPSAEFKCCDVGFSPIAPRTAEWDCCVDRVTRGGLPGRPDPLHPEGDCAPPPPPACTVDADCDDHLACTKDICKAGECSYINIAGPDCPPSLPGGGDTGGGDSSGGGAAGGGDTGGGGATGGGDVVGTKPTETDTTSGATPTGSDRILEGSCECKLTPESESAKIGDKVFPLVGPGKPSLFECQPTGGPTDGPLSITAAQSVDFEVVEGNLLLLSAPDKPDGLKSLSKVSTDPKVYVVAPPIEALTKGKVENVGTIQARVRNAGGVITSTSKCTVAYVYESFGGGCSLVRRK